MIKTRIVKFVGHIHNMQLCIEMISFINNENERLLRWFYSFVTQGISAGSSSCFNHALIESWFVWFGPWYTTVDLELVE